MADLTRAALEEDVPPRAPRIEIRRIGVVDLQQSVALGWRDFRRAPWVSLAFGGVYTLGGWLVIAILFGLGLPYLGYPTAMAFDLVAPFVAAGTYEVARRLESGRAITWGAAIQGVWRHTGRELGWLALVGVFTAILWVDFAWFLFLLFFDLHIPSVSELLVLVVTTGRGALFALVGNGVGAAIAMFVFSISVVSAPLLVDREIDFVTALLTSVRAVLANPLTMTLWAAAIALTLAVSVAAAFLGLAVTLPMLGYASWHLYRRVVV